MNRLIFLLPLFFYFNVQAQLAPVGSSWNYVHWTYMHWPESRNIKITIQKDTLIQGKVYSKLHSSYGYINESYKTLDNGKVYYFAQNGHHLMFDFNANAGDTIVVERHTFNGVDTIFPEAIRIDSIYYDKDINQDSLKIYQIRIIGPDQGMTAIIYERLLIGTTLMSEYNTIVSEDMFPINIEASNTHFCCYREPNGFDFLLTDSALCDILDVNEIASLQNKLFVYPNPTNQILNIQNETQYDISAIEIYDVAGMNLSSNLKILNNSIETNTLPSGNYWLIIEFTNHYRIIKKIVVASK